MSLGSMTFSKFLRESGEAVRAVEDGPVRLERRDGGDLILRSADRDASEHEGNRLAAALLSQALADATTHNTVDLLRKVFPWMLFLPEKDQLAFAEEILALVQASSAIDRPDLIATLASQWKHTAEVWADPVLMARLESDSEFLGEAISYPE